MLSDHRPTPRPGKIGPGKALCDEERKDEQRAFLSFSYSPYCPLQSYYLSYIFPIPSSSFCTRLFFEPLFPFFVLLSSSSALAVVYIYASAVEDSFGKVWRSP